MLSVIIACYNSEKFIKRAIESVLKQTYSNYEVILIDNNSTDNTITILYDYSKRYPDTFKVLSETKQGSPAARNKGLFEAKGEWIQFLDADDELLPEKFASQIELIENSAIDIVVGACKRFKTLSNGEIKEFPRYIETHDVWKGLLTSKLGITSANLWRRSCLLEVKGWNENLSSSQEYDLLFRLLKNNAAVGFCPLAQTLVHVTHNSISSTQNEDRIIKVMDNSVKLRIEIKEYLRSQGKLTKELSHFADTYNYYTLVMRKYRPLIPWSFRKGKIPRYVRKTLKENRFDVPLWAVVKLHAKGVLNIVRGKFSGLIKYLTSAINKSSRKASLR